MRSTMRSKIVDPLLIIHGMSDDNVLFENSTELIARLQHDEAPFEMMALSWRDASIAGAGDAGARWNTILRFLDDKVLGKAD